MVLTLTRALKIYVTNVILKVGRVCGRFHVCDILLTTEYVVTRLSIGYTGAILGLLEKRLV